MTLTVFAFGALIILAHLFALVFQRTRIPDVLLLMMLGLLIGPVLGIVEAADLGRVGDALSGVALVVILFESGTTIDLKVLQRALKPTLRLTVATFVATFVIFALAGLLAFQLSPLAALLLGGTLAGTSSAVVIPLVKGLGLGEKAGTVLVIESALTDVLCIVSVFAMLAAVEQGSVNPLRILGSVMSSLLFAALIGLVCGVAWMRALPLIRRLPNTIIATVGFVCVVYAITDLMGFSGAIASLAFGVTLTNHERMGWIEKLARQSGNEVPTTLENVERQFFSEIVFVLKTLFFVYLGLSIRFGDVAVLTFAVVTTILVYLARPYLAARTVDKDYTLREASVTGLMVPKGLAAAVLAGLPLAQGIEGGEVIRDVAFAVVLVSIVFTAVLAWAMEKPQIAGWYRRIFRAFAAAAGAPVPALAGASGAWPVESATPPAPPVEPPGPGGDGPTSPRAP